MAEPRKASDVLLEVEGKLDLLLKTSQSNDLTQKILSNKLTELIDLLKKNAQNPAPQVSPVRVEAVDVVPQKPMHDFDPERHTIVQAGSSFQAQTPPTKNAGERRTSRPEKKSTPTHLEGDDAYLKKPERKEPESPFPVQIPKGDKAEIIVPNQTAPTRMPLPPKKTEEPLFQDHQAQSEPSADPPKRSTIVSQRVVDKNGKVAFLADVVIVNHQTTESVFKSRTSAVGKWAAPLPMGNYRVSVKKKEPGNNKDIEVFQDIIVDGTRERMDLENLVMNELDLNKLNKGGK